MTTCKGCGKPIVWVKLADGTRVPLDPAAPVYAIQRDSMRVGPDGRLDQQGGLEAVRVGKLELAGFPLIMVSHFKTCPKASDFSRSKPKAPAGLAS